MLENDPSDFNFLGSIICILCTHKHTNHNIHITYIYHICISEMEANRCHLSARPFIHMNSNQTVKKGNLENNANVGVFRKYMFLKYTYFRKT